MTSEATISLAMQMPSRFFTLGREDFYSGICEVASMINGWPRERGNHELGRKSAIKLQKMEELPFVVVRDEDSRSWLSDHSHSGAATATIGPHCP